MIKLEKLKSVVANGQNKSCPFCTHQLRCSSYLKKGKVFLGREFWCFKCKAAYLYLKHKGKFQITKAEYKIPGFTISAYYDHPASINKPYCKTRILPYRKDLSYTAYDYNLEIKLQVELGFPITQEELEDKISLYTTFS